MRWWGGKDGFNGDEWRHWSGEDAKEARKDSKGVVVAAYCKLNGWEEKGGEDGLRTRRLALRGGISFM